MNVENVREEEEEEEEDDDDDDSGVGAGAGGVVVEVKGEYSRTISSSSFLMERKRGCPRTMGGVDKSEEGMAKVDKDREHMSTSGIGRSWI